MQLFHLAKVITANSWKSYSMEKNDHDRLVELEREMAAHEAMCDERWKTTFNRLQDIEDGLKKLENRIITASGSIIVFLAGVIITLLMR